MASLSGLINRWSKWKDRRSVPGMTNILDESVLRNWFSAQTMADGQLAHLINKTDFPRIKPSFQEISSRLFRVDNPYRHYEAPNLGAPMNYPSHIGEKTLQAITVALGAKPTLGVEVGSFIGSSATLLGRWLKQDQGTLICVDTWCGDINMWLLDNFVETMAKSDGNPKIFDRFMSNMIENDLTGTVIPFRVSSVVAARTFKVLNYEIDFVYLDSAHECGETFLELSLYHNVVKDGGVLFGDDYHSFPAVKHDLDLFCNVYDYELSFTGDGDTWIIKKRLSWSLF